MKTRVLIIGTGPYGISIANELYERNTDFVIVGKAFELWQEHTSNTMPIRSDWHTSEIYDRNNAYDFKKFLFKYYMDAAVILKERIPIDVFRHYLRFVHDALPYTIKNAYVTSLKKAKSGYEAQLDNGARITADKVIIATGIGAHKYLPKALKQLDPSLVQHTWDSNATAQWTNKNLLLIGNGQSAAETIVQLKINNNITWVRRKEPIFYSEPLNLPIAIFKFILHVSPYFYFLPSKIKAAFGKKFVIATITPDLKKAVMGNDVTHVLNDANRLSLEIKDGKVYSHVLESYYDHIIAATGYRYHIGHLGFIDPSLRHSILHNHGIPKLNFNFESSVDGLFFVGGIAEPTYGPAQRFIMGSYHVAKRLGKVMSK